jgi:hypothetical protein
MVVVRITVSPQTMVSVVRCANHRRIDARNAKHGLQLIEQDIQHKVGRSLLHGHAVDLRQQCHCANLVKEAEEVICRILLSNRYTPIDHLLAI